MNYLLKITSIYLRLADQSESRILNSAFVIGWPVLLVSEDAKSVTILHNCTHKFLHKTEPQEGLKIQGICM